MYNVTLNQIAHSIFETIRGKVGDDDNIDIDQVKDMVHNTRAMLLKQKFDKNLRVIDDVFTQSLGSIETEQVDSSIHPSILSERFMLRTLEEIPETIDRRNYEGTFTRIGPADRLSTRFNLVSYGRAIASGNGRFNRNEVFAFLLDSKINLISNSIYHKPIQFIDVIGVFQNPSQVAQFTDVDGNSLYSDNGRYPISRAMRDDLENIIIKERLAQQSQVPSDVVNDGTDTLDASELRS
jgi:hypothetical protein